ncbi:MAG: hypothetical protein OEW19_22995 [Acidobacteriota bacterium]|nr:hypothetical protein [Acidobacteriota bacterium]
MVQAGDASHAVLLDFYKRQPAGRRIPHEHGDGVVVPAGHVDVRSVRTHDHRNGVVEAVDAAGAILVDFEESQCSRRRITIEHGDRVVHAARDIDVLAVGTQRNGRGIKEPIHSSLTVLVFFEKRELPGDAIAREDG